MRRKADLVALAAVLLLVIAAFADLLVGGKALYFRDVSRFFYPNFVILRRLLRAGHIPFLNPYTAGWQPLLANPMYAALYPPQWAAALLPLPLGFHAFVVAHYLFAAAGMFLLLRSLRTSSGAAAFGAVSFALGGLAASLASLLFVLVSMAWMPWVGLFVVRLCERRRRRDFALAALALGVVLLIGEQAMILMTGALVAAYCVATHRLRGLALAAALCVAALAVGGAQIIPALDHARDSGRATALSAAAATRWSLDAARPLELIAPSSGLRSDDPSGAPWIFSWYAGMLAAALMAAGFVHRVRGWSFVAAVALAGYALALGRHGPLPAIRFLRYPEKWFIASSVVLVIFAALALDRWAEDPRFRRTTLIAAVAIVLVNAGTALRGAPPAGLILSLVLVAILSLRGRIAFALLALFVAADLVPRAYELAPRIDERFYTEPPPVARTLPPRARIYNDADWQLARMAAPPPLPNAARWERAHNAMWPDLQAVWGFDGVLENDVTLANLRPSREFQALFEEARFGPRRDLVPLLLTFAGASHVIALRDPASAADPVRVVPLPGNARYAFATALATPDRLAEPHPWPRGIAFVDRPFAPASGRVVHVVETPSSIDLDVDAAGDALLTIAVTPHKYWRATIDGRPAELLRANIGFQAVRVGKGTHHVAMRYRNPVVLVSAIVSIVAGIALAIIAATGGGPRSREPLPPSPR